MLAITRMLISKTSASATTAKLLSIENSAGTMKASAESNPMAGHGTLGTTDTVCWSPYWGEGSGADWERLEGRQTFWSPPSFWGLCSPSYHKVWAGLQITICLSNLKRSVISGPREDALSSVTFRKRSWLLILPPGFPLLYKEFQTVCNCVYPARAILLFCYL